MFKNQVTLILVTFYSENNQEIGSVAAHSLRYGVPSCYIAFSSLTMLIHASTLQACAYKVR